MAKKGFWLIVVAMIVGLFASSTMALDPFGKPAAGLVQGQWSVAFEYARIEETVELSGPGMVDGCNDEIEDITKNKYYGRIAYGPSDDWEVFCRLGMSDFDFDQDDLVLFWETCADVEVDTSGKFAYGLGVKHTFIDNGDTKWGGIMQYSHSEFDDEASVYGYDICIEGDWYEIQCAFGPSWMASDNLCIYGGPFLNYIEGDFNIEDYWEGEFEQESEIGGFLGLEADLGGGVFAGVEGQITQDAWLITGNVGVLLGP